jgi:hypothetical protein
MSGARKEDDPLIEIAELDAHPSSGLFMSALIVPEAISPRYECAPSDAAETNVHRVGQNLFERDDLGPASIHPASKHVRAVVASKAPMLS